MAKSTERGSCWSVTINNPISADEENIAIARQKGWKVEGQLERGKEGTPHYQLCVRTPQVRFSQVKSQFPRAHIELARNAGALQQYVVKEETRESELPTSQQAYPSQQQVWSWFRLSASDYSQEDLEREYREYSRKYVAGGVFEVSKMLKMYEYGQNRLLELFDEMINEKIQQGYYVELIGVNPQIRSAVKNYGFAIIQREKRRAAADEENLHRQTDRQTDEKNITAGSITDASSEEENQSSQQETRST